uniref:Uncharacterized protein n=1 Tax=Lepeophtheirus salmonis TaxID=72036 RepID=A0A0K2U837_LEPSM
MYVFRGSDSQPGLCSASFTALLGYQKMSFFFYIKGY